MMPELPNWIVALPVMVITVILIAWSGDLIVSSRGASPSRRATLLEGSFWLGLFFLLLATFMSGAITVTLLLDPHGTAPSFFGVGMMVTVIAGVASWFLLTFQEREDPGDER